MKNGCRAPYNIGCRVVDNKAQCICPTCPNVRKPVCASDDVQDISECHLKRQACEIYTAVTVAKQGACGTFVISCQLYNCYSIVVCNIVVRGRGRELYRGGKRDGGIRDSRFSLPI